MAVDLSKQCPPCDKGIPHLQPVDAEGHIVDVYEVDAEGSGQPGLLRFISLVGRLGNEGQVALDAL